MITIESFKPLLRYLGFAENGHLYTKHFPQGDFYLKVDFLGEEMLYPDGLKVNERHTASFRANENFVVFECVHRLLEKGYKPEHIELEPKWKLGHGASGGRADVLVRNQTGEVLLIIECKTAGKEYDKAWKDTLYDGGQLFSYIEQEKATQFVCLYASNFDIKANTIKFPHQIISVRDNPTILEDNPKLKSFAGANNVKERFKAWAETYAKESTQSGIFEENIQAYQIGKDKFALDTDTDYIDIDAKKGKYHEFRTLLRKHNVARKENAFEVLVNLFLCKIVDETQNPHDLKFFWKGIAYDNYFDFIDRLQELYKIGMEKFLGQEIMYISNAEIDKAFWAFKQKRNATKERIKEIFKDLKFYNDNAFGLISVRNAETFAKNTKVLIELVGMWQKLRLTSVEQNQFLGDMFEYFLDNGIKQSEGQFFTPVPICKFIVMSLPIEEQIRTKSEPLRAIDYACGSGHFLTEYATQLKPLVEAHKETPITDYYQQIVGIEKEDRLAKVAKVSAFMYGQKEIQIIDADALAPNAAIRLESFDVLVANPPFAVEDFLDTLAEEHRTTYDLYEKAADTGNKNIQCFFLERAKQLLAPDGVAGIVVPSSVLSNSDAMHIATRELLLKYFDIISIVELGSNTFGKTGTNTVVLFLRRKAQRPEAAKHYENRTLDFFDNWDTELKTNGGAYNDLDAVRRYCEHIDIPFEEYQIIFTIGKGSDFAKGSLDKLLAYEMFRDYKADFDASNDIKKLKENKAFKTKTADEQADEVGKRFAAYLQAIEKDKLYYFILAYHNPQKVVLVKSPADNKEQKQFLGYEWSGAKGSEGIKYTGGDTVYDINTPLFDPNHPQNTTKINYLIQQNYKGELEKQDISTPLLPFVSYTPLTDLLDFSRKDFNKAFSLSPKNMKPIDTKWSYIKIADAFLEVKNGKTVEQVDKQGKYKVSRIETIAAGVFNSEAIKWTNDSVKEEDFLQKGDILFSHINSVQHLGKTAVFNLDEKIVHGINLLKFRPNPAILVPAYAAYIFKHSDFTNEIKAQAQKAINQASVNTSYLNELKIPLPPLSVQAEIVAECEAIDAGTEAAQAVMLAGKKEIEERVREVIGNTNYPEIKIGNLTETSSGGTPLSTNKEYYLNGTIPWINSGEVSQGEIWKADNFITQEGLENSSAKMFPKETVLLAMYGATAGKVGILKIEACTNQAICGILPNETFLPKFLCLQLQTMYDYLLSLRTGVARDNLSQSKIKEIKVKLPPVSEQLALVSEIEAIEARIAAAQAEVSSAGERKQAVLGRYL